MTDDREIGNAATTSERSTTYLENALSEKQAELMKALEKGLPDVDVPIEGAINTKDYSHYKVSLAYGDLTLIVAMIRDYIKVLDKRVESETTGFFHFEYEAYYRPKFMKIADHISEQINYDYDKQIERCKKALEKKKSNSDVGEDAITLAANRHR